MKCPRWEAEGKKYPDLPFLWFLTSCPNFLSVEPNQKPYGKRAWGDMGHRAEQRKVKGAWDDT